MADGARPVETTIPDLRAGQLRTFSSLRYRNYRYLWISSFFSSAGDWVQQVTMGWLIFELTRSPFQVGALSAARSFPFLFVGPVSGVLSDRMDRRRLLIVTQAFLAVSALAIAVLVSSGRERPWHLFLFTIINGAGFAMNTPLRQALVANTVPRSELTNAIALTSTAININRVLGPALGGALIALFGASTNFFIQALCYVAVAAMVFQVHVARDAARSAIRTPYFSAMREGVHYVLGERRVFALILMAFIPSIFLMPFTTGLMPVFSKDVLGQGPGGLGLLLAMLGTGGLLGTLTVATLSRSSSSDGVQVAAAVGSGIALIVASRATSVPLAVPFLIGVGIGQMVFISTNNTVIQSLVSDELRGRVLSLYTLNLGMAPFGGFIAGALADVLDAPTAMLIGGVCTIGLVLLAATRFKMVGVRGPGE